MLQLLNLTIKVNTIYFIAIFAGLILTSKNGNKKCEDRSG